MSVQPAVSAGGPAAAVDYDRFRLRNFLTALAQEGELETYAEPAKLAEVGTILSETAKAVWFQQVGPERAALAGNVLASRSRLARAFGVAPRQLLAEILKRLEHKPEIVEVSRSEAPVREHAHPARTTRWCHRPRVPMSRDRGVPARRELGVRDRSLADCEAVPSTSGEPVGRATVRVSHLHLRSDKCPPTGSPSCSVVTGALRSR